MAQRRAALGARRRRRRRRRRRPPSPTALGLPADPRAPRPGLLADMDRRRRRALRPHDRAREHRRHEPRSDRWTDTASRAIAIVGRGRDPARRARRAGVLGEPEGAAATASREVPPERWDPALYYDPDPKAPDKTYSKIGGWVRDCEWDPLAVEAARSRRGSATRWTTPRSGRSPARREALARLRLAGAPARPRAHRRRSSATPWPASSTT